MIKIELTPEMTAVLLRSLSYGEHAVSQAEVESGIANIISKNISLIRRMVVNQLVDYMLDDINGGNW